MRVFPGSVLILAVLFFGGGAVHLFYEYADYRINGLPSVGTVLQTEVSPNRSGGKSSYTRYARVSFVTAQGTLIEHGFYDEISDAKQGDQIALFYKPDNPQDVIPDRWSALLLGVVMMLGALGGVCGVYACWTTE